MSLARHLELQTRTVHQLVDLLEQERRALSRGKIEGEQLGALAERKQIALQTLEQMEALRYGAQLKLGYGPGRQGALRAAQDADCVEQWKKLRTLAQRARELNKANGGALSLRMAGNQRVLGYLNSVIGQKLYGPDGRPQRDAD